MPYYITTMKNNLEKIVRNETIDVSSLYQLKNAGLIIKITFSQYVITEKGLNFIIGHETIKN